MQLSIYAKYNKHTDIKRDSTSHIQAICSEELYKSYYAHSNTKVFMASILLIPLFFIAMLSIMVRSLNKEINETLAKEINHANIAAIVLVGTFGQGVIVGMDIVAVYYVHSGHHEYKHYKVQHTINLVITYITLSMDLAVSSIITLCFLYLMCNHTHKDTMKHCPRYTFLPMFCIENIIPFCLLPCFYAVFGNLIQKKVWDAPRSDDHKKATNKRTLWILLYMLVAPVFSVASHSGYILIAWLTEPSKTTTIALISLAAIVYSFLIFRQCYIANVEVDAQNLKGWSILILLYPLYQSYIHCLSAMKLIKNYGAYKYYEIIDEDPDELQSLLGRRKHGKKAERVFNTQAFFAIIGWGLLTVGTLAFTITAFQEVPFTTQDLITYLLNIFQIFIVIITLLITYKIFSLSESEIQRFMKTARETYITNRPKECVTAEQVKDDNIDDVEASGLLTGKLMEVVIHQLPNNN